MSTEIGHRIRNARARAGLSQVELARKMGVSQATVAGWETGKHTPRWPKVDGISRILGVTPSDLIGGGGGSKRVPNRDIDGVTSREKEALRAFLEQFNPNEDAYLQIVQLVDQIGVSSSQQTALDHPDHVEDILDEYYPGWRDGEYSQCTLGAAESQAALSAIPTVQNARCIPVIDYVEAGSPREIVDAYECGDGHRHEWLDPASAEALGPHTFALEIRGRSMEPDFRESEIIIVDPDAPVRPGDIVVARVNGDAEATVKKYRDRGRDSQGHPVYELVPLNPDYATITIDSGNPGSLIGPVVQHKRNLR